MKKIALATIFCLLLLTVTGAAAAAATSFTFDGLGDDSYTVGENTTFLHVNANHDMFFSNRGKAPLLTTEMPAGNWSFSAKFQMPRRTESTHVGLIIWNSSSAFPCYALYVGPYERQKVRVEGSYSAISSGWSPDLRRIPGNSGQFEMPSQATKGWLKIVKTGTTYSFYFRAGDSGAWDMLGSITTEDDFSRIGFLAKSWGSFGTEVTFSNITIEEM